MNLGAENFQNEAKGGEYFLVDQLWSAVCKNLGGLGRQCMYDVPSLIYCMLLD